MLASSCSSAKPLPPILMLPLPVELAEPLTGQVEVPPPPLLVLVVELLPQAARTIGRATTATSRLRRFTGLLPPISLPGDLSLRFWG